LTAVQLIRSNSNPIIKSRAKLAWESKGTFNPAAILDNGIIRILYRAVGAQNISSLGYAESVDGENVTTRPAEPVISPSTVWEELGCEDPRITTINGRHYILYTAFSNNGPRIALASTTDFRHYDSYGLVGPNVNDKDCAMFPQLIDGKLAVLHRIEPSIELALFDDVEQLKASKQYWKGYMKRVEENTIMRPLGGWEKRKIGVGPPPIQTKSGWLVIYHGVDNQMIYRAGAALLDFENPRRIIARLPEPILEPTEPYEREGTVPNVVFPSGAVITGDMLRIFYGAADRVCCAASISTKTMLEALENNGQQ